MEIRKQKSKANLNKKLRLSIQFPKPNFKFESEFEKAKFKFESEFLIEIECAVCNNYVHFED